MNKIFAVLAASALLVVVGCNKDGAKEGDKTSTSSAAATGDSTGVPECDEYIKKYEGCLSKVPAAGKAAMETAFKAQRDSFKTSASTPEGKTALKATCKQMVDSLAQNPACK